MSEVNEEKSQEQAAAEAIQETAPAAETAQTAQAPAQAAAQAAPQEAPRPTKFCSHCGGKIDEKAVVCPLCGCQVEQIAQQSPNIVINNANSNANSNVNTQTTVAAGVPLLPRNKWVALLLCLFLGIFGIHKFYEGKVGMGVLYLFTGGLCGVGALVDFITLLFKPNPYYV